MSLSLKYPFLSLLVLFFLLSCDQQKGAKSEDESAGEIVEQKNSDTDNTPKYAVYVSSGDEQDGAAIGIYEWSPTSATMIKIGVDSSYTSSSYLAIDAENNKLYSVGSAIATFSINPITGKLTALNETKDTGKGACYLSLAHNKKFITVAYYSSGSASTYAILPDGTVGKEISTVVHSGSSVNKERQEAPHVHMAFAAPNSDIILMPDLGIDQVKSYRSDENGILTPAPNAATNITAGGGPRHLAFAPGGKRVYVLHELTGHVTGFGFDPEKGITDKINTVSTLPEDFKEFNKSADIHVSPDGKYLYASNRGHNSLAVFSIDQASGALTFLGAKDCGGDWPRAFAIDPSGDFILVANKNSNQISILKIDHATGFFEKVGEVATVLAPQCIRFLKLKTN